MSEADKLPLSAEEELFSRLMAEFIPMYGEELLQKNAELKAEDRGSISALAYVRCREFIRRQFAAVRRRAAQKVLKIASAAACAVVILGGSVLLAVPSLHDAVFGRTETVEPMPLPGQHDTAPVFRRVLPPMPTPTPTPTPTPSSEPREFHPKWLVVDYFGEEHIVDTYEEYIAIHQEKEIREFYAYMIRHGGDPQKYNFDRNYPNGFGGSASSETVTDNRPTLRDEPISHRSLVTRP